MPSLTRNDWLLRKFPIPGPWPKPNDEPRLTQDHRALRSALFDNYDSIEEGGIRASRSYSRDIDEHDNDKAVDNLQDRVSFLKKLTGDIHEEVESHNRILDKMGNDMDSSRGIMSRTMDRFKIVFDKKGHRKTCKLAGWFVLSFLLIYYVFRYLMYFMHR